MIALLSRSSPLSPRIDEHAPGLFAQVATIGISKKRIDRRTRVDDDPAFGFFFVAAAAAAAVA